MSDDFWTEFEASDFPPKFKFENPGDKIVGIIRDRRVYEDPKGKRTPILEIETDGGEVRSVFIGNVDLLRQVVDLAPEIGDKFGAVFQTIERIDGGKTMHRFGVKVEKPSSPVQVGNFEVEPVTEGGDYDGSPF